MTHEHETPLPTRLASGALKFVSTATAPTLVACFVGFAAIANAILGRVGILLVGGIAGAIARDCLGLNGPGNGEPLRKHITPGPELLSKLPGRHEGGQLPEQTDGNVLDAALLRPRVRESCFGTASKAAVAQLEAAMVRDYVESWSSYLISDRSFEWSCRRTVTTMVASMSQHVSQKRPAETFLNFTTNAASVLLVFLKELSIALASSSGDERNVHGAVGSYLEQNPNSALANILDKEEQERKLRAVSEDFFQAFLEPSSFRCEPLRLLLREALAGIALESVLATCSEPGWINEWIIYLLEGDEPELMNAIDAEVGRVGEGDASVKTSRRARQDMTGTIEPGFEAASGDEHASDHLQVDSKSEQVMEEARQEAQRLSALIALEDREKLGLADVSTLSTNNTETCATPTSSQDDPVSLSAEEEDGHSPEKVSTYRQPFTDFNEILKPTSTNPSALHTIPLTLLGAKVMILDDGPAQGNLQLKSKPSSTEYLLQVEPASAQHAGWITSRKYTQFEELHEFISRIAVISGVQTFSYKTLPPWKNRTKDSLRSDLEAYLSVTLSSAPLAECDAMRRFLEKDRAEEKLSSSKNVLGFSTPDAFQTIGKGVFGALANAPKGAAGSGKAIIDGVSGVFAGTKRSTFTGLRREDSGISAQDRPMPLPTSNPRASASPDPPGFESNRGSDTSSDDPAPRPSLPERPASNGGAKVPIGGTTVLDGADEPFAVAEKLPASQGTRTSADHVAPRFATPSPIDLGKQAHVQSVASPEAEMRTGDASANLGQTERADILASQRLTLEPDHAETTKKEHGEAPSRQRHVPLTTEESRVAIELIFAVVNELFSLTAVWSVRRTFLTAAKAYILRPGNLGLESIRELLQSSVIDSNTSDDAIATYLRKMRENALPTKEEMQSWPPNRTDEELERLREKARRLFVDKAMPPALTGIMSVAASSDALSKVFDALQIREVSRGLVFALLLQAARIVIY